MLDYKAALSLPQAINAMLSKLDAIRDEIRNTRGNEPVARPYDRNEILMLSNLGNTQARVPSVELHIIGALLGGDTSGRAILQIGTYQIPIWITLNSANFLFFREDMQIVVKGDRISYTPPGGTNWDVVIFGHARSSDRAYKAIQSSKGPGGKDA